MFITFWAIMCFVSSVKTWNMVFPHGSLTLASVSQMLMRY